MKRTEIIKGDDFVKMSKMFLQALDKNGLYKNISTEIIYEPLNKHELYLSNSVTSDGTLYFTDYAMCEMYLSLNKKNGFNLLSKEECENIEIIYSIGDLKVVTTSLSPVFAKYEFELPLSVNIKER